MTVRNANTAKPDKPRAASSDMDKRVTALPAPEKRSTTLASQRFDMQRDGRTMSLDRFDAWMQQRSSDPQRASPRLRHQW